MTRTCRIRSEQNVSRSCAKKANVNNKLVRLILPPMTFKN